MNLRIPRIVFAVLSAAHLSAEDLLLHRGEPFATPGLGQLSPQGANVPGDELIFRRVFHVDPAGIGKLRALTKEVSEEKAKALAVASLTEAEQRNDVEVVSCRLVKSTEPETSGIRFHLVELKVGYVEVTRAVLMDGTVLHARLEAVEN